jgi:hypothetical protein
MEEALGKLDKDPSSRTGKSEKLLPICYSEDEAGRRKALTAYFSMN